MALAQKLSAEQKQDLANIKASDLILIYQDDEVLNNNDQGGWVPQADAAAQGNQDG